MDERGYIRFDARLVKGPAPDHILLPLLNYWRTRCFDAGMIGVYENGIGYGNISQRVAGTRGFVISGTQTGSRRALTRSEFTRVIDFDIDQNFVLAVGSVAPSSESLSHATLYGAGATIGAALHIHHRALWERWRSVLPTTDGSAEAGTPEMAREIGRLARTDARNGKVIVMGAHEGGLMAFGTGLDEAGQRLFELLD